MITLCVEIADEQGFKTLKTKKQIIKPPTLTEEQVEEIQGVLKEDDPKKYWT